MIAVHRHVKAVWAHKRRLVGTFARRLPRRGVPRRNARARRHAAGQLRPLFTEANAGTDVVVRSATDVGRAPARSTARSTRACSPRSRRCRRRRRAPSPTVEGYGQLVGARRRAVGGNGPPTLAGNWIDDPALNPYRLVEGRAPRSRRRGRDQPRRGQGRATCTLGDTTTVLTPQPVRVHDRRHRHLRRRGRPRAGARSPPSPCPPRALLLRPDRPGRRAKILVRAEPRGVADELAARLQPVLPRRRGDHRARSSPTRTSTTSTATSSTSDHAPDSSSPASRCWWRRSASTTRSRSWSRSAPESRRCCARSAPPGARSVAGLVEALAVGVVARPSGWRVASPSPGCSRDVRRLRLRAPAGGLVIEPPDRARWSSAPCDRVARVARLRASRVPRWPPCARSPSSRRASASVGRRCRPARRRGGA